MSTTPSPARDSRRSVPRHEYTCFTRSNPPPQKAQSRRSLPRPRSLVHHPPEVLCEIFHYAVGDSGIRRLLPLLHVCCQWRRSALGDSSLWTTIYLSDITAPLLLDMILAYAGERLFRVYVDHPDSNRGAKLWKLLDRIEELDCSYGTYHISPFLSSLGPAPNLKVFRLHDEDQDPMDDDIPQQRRELPKVFRGCLPSLRELHLTVAVTWPAGLFKDLRSLELGADADDDFSPTLVLDVLRESPLLENLHLVGYCNHLDEEPPAVVLPSLKNCTLVGIGAIFLIWYMDIPASTNISLSTPPFIGNPMEIYPVRDLSLAPCLHVLDKISAVSFSIGFDTIELQVQNDSGGALSLQVYYHETAAAALTIYFFLLNGFFSEATSRSQATRSFSLHIERGATRDDVELMICAATFLRFISSAASLERVKLCGVPAKALSFHLQFLHIGPGAIQFPNLQQIQIETAPLRSAKSSLEYLDMLLRTRNDSGTPLRLVDMKVNCETLIPMAEHSAFLTAWKDLVGEDVRLEYFRDRVEDEASGAESDSCDSDWESWDSGKWPKAASETRGVIGT